MKVSCLSISLSDHMKTGGCCEFKYGKYRPGSEKRNYTAFAEPVYGAAGVVLWWMIYGQLPELSKWLTYDVLPIENGSHLGSSVEFFLYDTPKVMMLLFWWFLAWVLSEVFLPRRKPGRFCPVKANLPATCLPRFLEL